MFMQAHVFAVWDFMSLLKALQRDLTCVTLPWVPVGDPETRLLINQIVMGEESDQAPDGRICSHFELYLEAMEEAGADIRRIQDFMTHLQNGSSVTQALEQSQAPAFLSAFVEDTFAFIHAGKVHQTAAAFTYGREDLIPGIFGEIVAGVDATAPGHLGKFLYYLERHIELDGDEHGELGRQMVAKLCGDDDSRWAEASEAATQSLESRLRLWDGIHESILKLRTFV